MISFELQTKGGESGPSKNSIRALIFKICSRMGAPFNKWICLDMWKAETPTSQFCRAKANLELPDEILMELLAKL